MRYTVEIDIDLPRDRVIELFDSTENMKKWQKGLISTEHVSGVPGEVGAKMKLEYKMGKREVEMIETITKRDLPDEFAATYDAKNVHNIVDNSFIQVSDYKTKWVSYNEFQMSGMMKLIAFLMPGAFKKQSLKFMADFKAFAENA